MLKRLWLLFAQIVTLLLAILFILSTFKPNWLDGIGFNGVSSITINESSIDPSTPNPGSHHEAVKRSMPAVVNILRARMS